MSSTSTTDIRANPHTTSILPNPPSYEAVDKSKNGYAFVQAREISPPELGTRTRINFEYLEKPASWKSWLSASTTWGRRSKVPGKIAQWKPATLRWPILGLVSVTTIALIIGIQILQNLNEKNGGIAFADSINDFSSTQLFLTQYFPTILAVFFSIIWSWIDLDVKRLEPWFQMSSPGGALADRSILLHYPSDFLAFIPLRAARRRHWCVMCGGLAMMVIFWIITPLQGAIFSSETISVVGITAVILSNGLPSVDIQNQKLDTGFVNSAYSFTWLGQPLPSYTTKDFALRPFSIADSDEVSPGELWQASTDLYQTDLECWPAGVNQSEHVYYTLSDGRGCVFTHLALPEAGPDQFWSFLSVGFYESARSNYFLQSECPDASPHESLLIWADGSGANDSAIQINGGFSAMFCDSKYYKTSVNATISASDKSVIDISPISNRVELSETEFNTTNFEVFLRRGASTPTTATDFTDLLVPNAESRLVDTGIVLPTTLESAFALGLSNQSLAEFKNTTTMVAAIQVARRLLFSLAVSELMNSSLSTTARPQEGTVSRTLGAIVVSKPIAIIVEVALGIVLIITGIIWGFSLNRILNLTSDPASISSIMEILASSPKALALFTRFQHLDAKDQVSRLGDTRFRLALDEQRNQLFSRLEYKEDGNPTARIQNQILERNGAADTKKPVQPLELRIPLGISFAFGILAAVVALFVLRAKIIDLNGFSLPSPNIVVRQILENYIPIVFATLIEPFWVVLNRLLCILQPFEELRTGAAQPSKSVQAKYTSLPPQLIVWRALRSGHFLLAAVCTIAVLANVLAVALSGLFNEAITNDASSIQTQHFLSPKIFTNVTAIPGVSGPTVTSADQFYVVMANLSTNTTLPPWTDQGYFYSPVDLNVSRSLGNSSFSLGLKTRGYGVKTKCSPLIVDQAGSEKLNFVIKENGARIDFSVNQTSPQGPLSCVNWPQSNAHFESSITNHEGFEQEVPRGSDLALEITTTFRSNENGFGTSVRDLYCAQLFVAGWVRLQQKPSAKNASAMETTSQAEFLSCHPTLETAMFDVIVDSNGRILNSTQAAPFDDISVVIPPDDTRWLYFQLNNILAFDRPESFVTSSLSFTWHNNTVSRDWLNYLITLATQSSAHVDPSLPLPNITQLASAIETIYARSAAVIFSQNQHMFASAAADLTTTALTISIAQTKIFMNDVMFFTSAILLLLNLVAAVLVYTLRPRAFLPTMPTTIAAIATYVAASHGLRNFAPEGRARDGVGAGGEERYAYGRFLGTDGKAHVGIELARLTVPLEAQEGRGDGWWRRFGRGARSRMVFRRRRRRDVDSP